VVKFTLALGANGAPNTGQGSYVFEGSIRGRTGTVKVAIDNWTAGGDAAFTSAQFKMVSGSGTGDLSNLVEYEGFLQRDETADPPVGAYWGTIRFEGDQTPSKVDDATKDLSDYSVAELFAIEIASDITADELAAELERRK